GRGPPAGPVNGFRDTQYSTPRQGGSRPRAPRKPDHRRPAQPTGTEPRFGMPVPPPAYLDVRGRDARLPPAAAESVGHHDRVWRVWVRVLSAPVGWSIPSLIAPKGSVGTIGA